MENLLVWITYVIVVFDNFLVSDKNNVEHLRNWEEVLKQLSKVGLRLKKNKCVFMVLELCIVDTKLPQKVSYQWKWIYK